ncbi:RodZ domain-containing protein [Dechloromonas hortensis]|uniref:RodZ domain-containing protein n=1 Tax=Dechloromonas hortensis TaxID=337779 RepID=UPI001B85BAC4|nr:RodZ domain-containing protein [Dechloromonas hortensis]
MSDQISSVENLVDETVSEAVPNVGAQLREAREARGIQLPEVAAALKLGAKQVEALENGDWLALPGHTFIRGFVRNYARLVQIDPLPLMAQLDLTLQKPVTRLGDVDSRPATMPQSSGHISRRDRAVVTTGAVLVALAGLVYFLLPNDLSAWRESTQSLISSFSQKDAQEQSPAAVAEPAAEPVFPPGTTPQQVMNPQVDPVPAPAEPVSAPAMAVPPAMTAAAPNAEAQSKAPLRFVFEKESWVEVRDRDSKVIFSQRGTAGLEQAVSGNGPFSLVIGFAPGVKLFWRGQVVDLVPHTRGDVARLVLE